MKRPNFSHPLYGAGEHNVNIVFVFFQTQIQYFWIQPQKISPTFNKLKETVRIHFLRDVFCLLSSRILLS